MSSRDPCWSTDNVHGTPVTLEPRGFPRLADGLFHVQLTPKSRQVRHRELSVGSILHPRPLLWQKSQALRTRFDFTDLGSDSAIDGESRIHPET